MLESVKYRGYELRTEYEENGYLYNPRDCDSFFNIIGGTNNIACPDNSSYRLTGNLYLDTANFYDNDFTPSQVKTAKKWVDENLIVFKVYAYIHSDINLTIGGVSSWDSGLFGVICVKKDKIRKEYGVKRITEKLVEDIKKRAAYQLAIYSDYLNGYIYTLNIVKDNVLIESIEGIYDSDSDWYIKDARQMVDEYIKEKNAKRVAKLKELIKAHVSLLIRPSILEAVK